MQATLIVKGGKFHGKEIAIEPGELLIGREPKCNVRLKDRWVSRVHCTLIADGEDLKVRDEKSGNGTIVNKRRLRGELPLEDGDTLQVGLQLFAIRLEQAAAPKTESIPIPIPEEPHYGADETTFIGDRPIIDPNSLQDFEDERLRHRLDGL